MSQWDMRWVKRFLHESTWREKSRGLRMEASGIIWLKGKLEEKPSKEIQKENSGSTVSWTPEEEIHDAWVGAAADNCVKSSRMVH